MRAGDSAPPGGGRRWMVVGGAVLIAAALVGFLTVADELHHTGEYFAVLGILVCGVAFVAAGRFPGVARHLSLQWVPLGVATGMLGGAFADREVAGVCAGLLVGLGLARARRQSGRSHEGTT